MPLSLFKYSEKKLARDIGRVAESIDRSLSWEYQPQARQVTLTSDDGSAGGPFTIFLGNIFLKISELPGKERLPAIEAFLTEALLPRELSPDELLASLSLRVRTAFELDLRDRNIGLIDSLDGKGPSSIVRECGELLVEVVSDGDESIRPADIDDLSEIGVDEEQAVRIATAKIRRHTDDSQWQRVDESIWASSYHDDYDFARLIAAEESPRFPFDGSAIVFAPSHSVCLATGSLDSNVINRMLEIGYERSASHRPFSEQLWAHTGNAWQPWNPASDSELADIAALQSLREESNQYAETKDYLERSLGDEDVYVATFNAVKNHDGLMSYCVYTLDLPSYLPKSEYVVVFDPNLPEDRAVLGKVAWQTFADTVGSSQLQPTAIERPEWCQLLEPLAASQKDELRELVTAF